MSQIKGIGSSAAFMVAAVALVAALGGGAVAGVTISKLSEKEKKQVKRLSKRQAKKLDRSIELTPGPRGEPGPQGPRGERGIPGQNAAENVVVRESGLSSGERTVSCQGSERVVGGGASTSQPAALTVNGPTVAAGGTATGWRALADDNAPTNAYVLCASP